MDIVSARFPGVERCEMDRIARWARVSPRSALGGWPNAALQQMWAQGAEKRHPLAGTPMCECAEDAEAVYLTLLDHHVLEVLRSSTPESLADRVIRFHMNSGPAAGGGAPPAPDPETDWCLQSASADQEHWDSLWKQYRKANSTRNPDAPTLAVKLRHRAQATQHRAARTTAGGSAPPSHAAQLDSTSRRRPPSADAQQPSGCVDSEFCELGASDLMKTVALDLRMLSLAFSIDAVAQGRRNQ